MFFSPSFCLIKTFLRLRHISQSGTSPRSPLPQVEKLKRKFYRCGSEHQNDPKNTIGWRRYIVEYPCSQQSQTFIFTKELTPSKMNTIPFITEELWSKMILLNLKLLTNIQWNYYYIWSIYNIVQHIKFAETSHENYNFNRTASYIWILRDLRLGNCKIRYKGKRESSYNVIVITRLD